MLNFAKEMQEPRKEKNRRRVPWALGTIVLVLLLFLVLLQSSNLWQTFSVDTATDTLLLYALSSLNFIAFVVFGFIFLRSIFKLVRERRTFQLGSKIKTRLLLYFFTVSLLPIIAMAGFSYLFMNRALDRWFTQIPENVVRAPIKLQEQAIADQKSRLGDTAQMLARSMEGKEPGADELAILVQDGKLARVAIVSRDGKVIAESEKSLDKTETRTVDTEMPLGSR